MNTENNVKSSEKEIADHQVKIKARRELDAKPFAELTDTQKIDRLVEEIKSQRYTTQRVYQLENRIRTLENHKHDHVTGEVMTKLQNNYGGEMTASSLAGSVETPRARNCRAKNQKVR